MTSRGGGTLFGGVLYFAGVSPHLKRAYKSGCMQVDHANRITVYISVEGMIPRTKCGDQLCRDDIEKMEYKYCGQVFNVQKN